jgi:hypothetical protein
MDGTHARTMSRMHKQNVDENKSARRNIPMRPQRCEQLEQSTQALNYADETSHNGDCASRSHEESVGCDSDGWEIKR